MIEATLHGSMATVDHRAPMIQVPPHMIVILTTSSNYAGGAISTAPQLYDNIMPATSPTRPNIIDMFSNLLGQHVNPQYQHLYYAVEGDYVPNRILAVTPEDLSVKYDPYPNYLRSHHFGINELNNTTFVQSPLQPLLMTIRKGQTDVAGLLYTVHGYYKPTEAKPVILYIVACDVSPRGSASPHRSYICGSQARTQYALAHGTRAWPNPGDVAIHSNEKLEGLAILAPLSAERSLNECITRITTNAAPPPEPFGAAAYDPPLFLPPVSAPPIEYSAWGGPLLPAASAPAAGAGAGTPPPFGSKFGGHLKKKRIHRSKKRCPRSRNRKKTGSRRASAF